jgi:hypothetical protein
LAEAEPTTNRRLMIASVVKRMMTRRGRRDLDHERKRRWKGSTAPDTVGTDGMKNQERPA